METKEQTSVPKLQKLGEFQNILRNYKPSQASLTTLRSIPLVLLVGPTAAGRNTLINLLAETDRYYYIVSDTTRPKRINNGVKEQDGVEYWFKSEQEFLLGLQSGKYLEASVIHNQQVSGISVKELERAQQSDKIAVKEIEVNGADYVEGFKPDTLLVFLLPPGFETWMQRIKGRGDMTEGELRRRLESSVVEMKKALKEDYYKFVINHEIHEAAAAVDELARGAAPSPDDIQAGHNHAEQLIIDVQLYLNA